MKTLVSRHYWAALGSHTFHGAIDRGLEVDWVFSRWLTPSRLSRCLLMTCQVWKFEIEIVLFLLFLVTAFDNFFLMNNLRCHFRLAILVGQVSHELLHGLVLVLEEYLVLQFTATWLLLTALYSVLWRRHISWSPAHLIKEQVIRTALSRLQELSFGGIWLAISVLMVYNRHHKIAWFHTFVHLLRRSFIIGTPKVLERVLYAIAVYIGTTHRETHWTLVHRALLRWMLTL